MSRAPVALVTGAARGIGAATVRALAAQGWAVLAVDRAADDPALPYPLATPADLDAVVAARAATGRCAPSPPTCATGARWPPRWPRPRRAGAAWTRRVAAAGVIAGGVPLWEMPAEQEQAVLDIDLGGVLNLARAAIPALLRRPEPRAGRFLAVASAAATRGLPMLAAYCAAKAGVAGLIRALAVELGGTGVTANAVSPGSTDTPILAESARLYGLPGAADVRRPAAARAAARPGRGRRRAGLPGRPGQRRDDRRRRPGRRRAGPVNARRPPLPGRVPARARPGHRAARRRHCCSAGRRRGCCG